MKITGEIIDILPAQSGVSRNGNQWKRQEYVIAESGERFNNRLCYTLNGENVDRFIAQLGDIVEINIGIDCRQYKERWYNEITCYAVKVLGRRVKVSEDGEQEAHAEEAPQQPQAQGGVIYPDRPAPQAPQEQAPQSQSINLPF